MHDERPVNVKSYGAMGDGKTDDTSAVLYAVSLGRPIYFPAGTYIINGAPFRAWGGPPPPLSPAELEQIQKPLWEDAVGRAHDWRNHVPDRIRALWATFSQGHQEAIYRWTKDLASREVAAPPEADD